MFHTLKIVFYNLVYANKFSYFCIPYYQSRYLFFYYYYILHYKSQS